MLCLTYHSNTEWPCLQSLSEPPRRVYCLVPRCVSVVSFPRTQPHDTTSGVEPKFRNLSIPFLNYVCKQVNKGLSQSLCRLAYNFIPDHISPIYFYVRLTVLLLCFATDKYFDSITIRIRVVCLFPDISIHRRTHR